MPTTGESIHLSQPCMAPRIPPSSPSRHGQPGATVVITISSGSDLSSVPQIVIPVSSDSDEATSRPRRATWRRRTPPPSSSRHVRSPFVIRGGDEAMTGRRRPPSPSFPAVSVVRPPAVVIAASSDDGGGSGEAKSRRPPSPSSCGAVSVVRSPVVDIAASSDRVGDEEPMSGTARPRRPAPPSPSAVTVCSPVDIPLAPSAYASDDVEASSQRKYRKWDGRDERQLLDTMAKLRKQNHGVLPKASMILNELDARHALAYGRRGLDVTELSDKMKDLKNKFAKAAAKAAATGRQRPHRNNRNKMLYEICKKVWPDIHEDAGAAHLAAKAACRRERARRRGGASDGV
ncbi:hypothetical protein BAE44_0008149 [Dichanthelium oligosanthes]|uniref:Glabrous enhancer-binding protein-like DBD domain-containing protein n=1 Tax=Dichanthelium oligosanthes TaxID=888268 RepID=A0A1E5W0C6_9POAL|nr:hypothetical protein BAE44_0008149 [Dichanthelium oligosanthes]